MINEQRIVCEKFGTDCIPPSPGVKLGIAANVRTGIQPLNGLRHPQTPETSGWYIWAGEELSQDSDFFSSLHVEHLAEWCPDVVKFLGLPPGWRFLKAGDHEDVWFDPDLLVVG
jgi:hypothetical protein